MKEFLEKTENMSLVTTMTAQKKNAYGFFFFFLREFFELQKHEINSHTITIILLHSRSALQHNQSKFGFYGISKFNYAIMVNTCERFVVALLSTPPRHNVNAGDII